MTFHKKHEYLFMVAVSVFLCINQLVFFHITKYSTYLAIFFGIWGAVVILFEILKNNKYVFSNHINILGIIFAITAVVSLVANGFVAPVDNMYNVLSILINFLIFFNFARKNDTRMIDVVMKVLFWGLFVYMLLNFVTIFFHLDKVFVVNNQVRYLGWGGNLNRFSGVSGNPNRLGRIAISLIFISLWFMNKEKNKLNIILYTAPIIISIYFIYISMSRAVIMGIVFGILCSIIVFCLMKKGILGKISKAIVVLSVIASICLGTFLVAMFVSTHNKTENSIQSYSEVIYHKLNKLSSDRLFVMEVGVKATFDRRPIAGFSYENIRPNIENYIAEKKLNLYSGEFNFLNHMHNMVIQSLAAYGILGCSVLLMIYWYFISLTCKIVKNKDNIEYDKKYFLMFVFVLSACFFISMLEASFIFGFAIEIINLVLMLFLGLYVNFAYSTFGVKMVSNKVTSFIGDKFIVLTDGIRKLLRIS
ncbi:MAG: O-antigen ligase family protein [Erysipelotrichaceae bacterium]